jgi:hypothetical protein
MVDGKTLIHLSDISSAACPLCRAKEPILNQKPSPSSPIVPDYGLGTLHGWLRGLDFFLSLAYANGVEKKDLQEQFRARLGILVDMPKSGSGNTNDGNTARIFFKNPSTSGSITRVPEDLINRYATIMGALSSSRLLNPKKLEEYCSETAHRLTSEYPTKNLTPTVHKILYHSPKIVEYFNQFSLPVGFLSEEALESRNKDIRNFRSRFARKTGRIDNLKDSFHRLFWGSDIYFGSFRYTPMPKTSHYYPDMEQLFLIN